MLMQSVAVVAAVVLAAGCGFQVMLAAGAPLGHLAWGGAARRLPGRLRWASLAAACVLALAGWIILARADLVTPGSTAPWVRVGTWIFAAVFALNSAGNLASASGLERRVMTPLTLVLTMCFALVAGS
jgi:hypothetical protein